MNITQMIDELVQEARLFERNSIAARLLEVSANDRETRLAYEAAGKNFHRMGVLATQIKEMVE